MKTAKLIRAGGSPTERFNSREKNQAPNRFHKIAMIRCREITRSPAPESIESTLHEVERGNDILVAPELILSEVTQVLIKKKKQGLLTREEMGELLDCIISLPIRLFRLKPIIQHSVELTLEYKLTVYDAIFLALAEEKNGRLITVDRILQRAAEKWV